MKPLAAGAKRVVVGIGELQVSSNPTDELITYALGSCLGVVIYDAEAHVGGLLHAMLPVSSSQPERAREQPGMFVDTGVPQLFRECYALGASRDRLIIKVAGGACFANERGESDLFTVGDRNLTMLRKLLWNNGFVVRAKDVGGALPRTLSLAIADGQVTVACGTDHWSL